MNRTQADPMFAMNCCPSQEPAPHSRGFLFMVGWIDLDKEFDMRKTLLFVLLLIVGCSKKSVDKTTLIEKDGVFATPSNGSEIPVFVKDRPIYDGQKKLLGKFVK